MWPILEYGLNVIDMKWIPRGIRFDQQMGEVIFDENFRHTLVVENATSFRIELGQSVVNERKFSSVNIEPCPIVDVFALVLGISVGPEGIVRAHVDGMVVGDGILFPQALTVLINFDDARNAVQRIDQTRIWQHQRVHDTVVRIRKTVHLSLIHI